MGGSLIDIRIIARDMASPVLKSVQGNMSGFGSTVQAAAKGITSHFGEAVSQIPKAAGIITGAFTAIGAGIFKLAKDSGSFASIKDSFNTMSKGMKVDGQALVKNVKKATGGTVSELDVMNKFVKSTALIGKEALGKDIGGTFERMAVIAKKASRATGQDVEYMFESIVTGVGRASPLILDNLGITVRASDVYDAYAKTLGKTASQLTIAEQKTALLNAVLEQGEEKYADVAVSAGGISGAWQKLSATAEELRLKVGEELTPIFTPLVNAVEKFLGTLKDKSLADFGINVEDIQKRIDELKKKFEEINEQLGFTDKLEKFGEWAKENQSTIYDFAQNLFILAAALTAIKIAMGFLTSPLTLAMTLIGFLALAVTAWQNDMWGVRTELQPLVDKLKEFGNWIKENKDFLLTFVKVMGVMAGVILGVAAALTILSTSLAIVVSPVVIAIALFVAIALAITVLIRNLDRIKAKFKEVANMIKDNFTNAFKSLKENFERAKDEIVDYKNMIVDSWNKIIDFFKSLPDEAKKAFNDLKDKISDAIDSLKEDISEAIDDIGAFFDDLPRKLGEVMGKLTAEILWFATVTVPNFVQGVIDWFVELFTVKIPELIQTAIDWLTEFFTVKIPELIQTAIDWLEELFTVKIPEFLQKAMDWFAELPGKIWDALVKIGNTIAEKVKEYKDAFTDWIDTTWTRIKTFLSELPGKIKEELIKAKDAFTTWASDTINGIMDFFNSLPDKISEVWEKIKKKLSEWWGEFTSGFLGGFFGTIEEKKRATGGVVREPLTLVGERGPELVSLPRGSRVHTAVQTQQMQQNGLTGRGEINLTVNNYNTDIDEEKLAGDLLFKTKLAYHRGYG